MTPWNIEFRMAIFFVLTTKFSRFNNLGLRYAAITRSTAQTTHKRSIFNMKIIYPTWRIISRNTKLDITSLIWWVVFMHPALDLRIKPLDVGIPVHYTTYEVKAIGHNSSSEQWYGYVTYDLILVMIQIWPLKICKIWCTNNKLHHMFGCTIPTSKSPPISERKMVKSS